MRIEIYNIDLSSYRIEDLTDEIRKIFPTVGTISYRMDSLLTLESIDEKIEDIEAKIKEKFGNFDSIKVVSEEGLNDRAY